MLATHKDLLPLDPGGLGSHVVKHLLMAGCHVKKAHKQHDWRHKRRPVMDVQE
jgi:hypothetical protein